MSISLKMNKTNEWYSGWVRDIIYIYKELCTKGKNLFFHLVGGFDKKAEHGKDEIK